MQRSPGRGARFVGVGSPTFSPHRARVSRGRQPVRRSLALSSRQVAPAPISLTCPSEWRTAPVSVACDITVAGLLLCGRETDISPSGVCLANSIPHTLAKRGLPWLPRWWPGCAAWGCEQVANSYREDEPC